MEIILDKTFSRRYLTKLIFSAYGIIIGIPLLLTLYGIYSSDGLSETLKIVLRPRVIFFIFVQTLGQLLFCFAIAPLTFRLIRKYSFLLVGIMTALSSNFIIVVISIAFFSVDYRMMVAIIPSILTGAIVGRLMKDKVK